MSGDQRSVLTRLMFGWDPSNGVFANGSFRNLWAAASISLLGSQVTLLALPLTAILILHATPFEMGILVFAASIPPLLGSLPIGVWVDRARRRRLMIAADLGRFLLLGSIPVAAILQVLTFPQLVVVAMVASMLNLIFDISATSFLPSVLPRTELVAGNSRLEIARSTAQIGGPPLGGFLIQAISPPLAIAVDAISFLMSAGFLARVATPEEPGLTTQRRLTAEIRDGLKAVVQSPILRGFALNTALFNTAWSAFITLYALYATRSLHLSPGLLGLTLAGVGPGFLIGAMLVGHLNRRFGIGPTILVACVCDCAGALLIPAAAGPTAVIVVMLFAGNLVLGLMNIVIAVNAISVRQAITPDHLRGRVNATMRLVAWSIAPFGALVAGLLAQSWGPRTVLLAGASLMLVAAVPLILSPIVRLRETPVLAA